MPIKDILAQSNFVPEKVTRMTWKKKMLIIPFTSHWKKYFETQKIEWDVIYKEGFLNDETSVVGELGDIENCAFCKSYNTLITNHCPVKELKTNVLSFYQHYEHVHYIG